MKLLVFDTETTGLPTSFENSSKGPNIWPHIVSISWVIMDGITNVIEKQKSYIIRPLRWIIPEDSIKIHGITQQIAEEKGHNLSDVLGEFLAEQYDALVAHNIRFDYNVLHNAIHWDLGLPFQDIKKPKICTMELSRDICKLPTKYKLYKSPKLSELYEFTFRKSPEKSSLHNSMYDVQILTEIIHHCDPLRLKMNLPTITVNPINNHAHSTTQQRILSIRFD